MTPNRLLVAAIAIATCSVANLKAQGSRSVVDGVVTDTNLVALDSATITIAGSVVRVVTGANGRFRIGGLMPGEYVLVVERRGFIASSNSIQVLAEDTLRVSFALQPGSAPADSGRILVWSNRLAEFEARRRRGGGQFMSQSEIQKQNVKSVGDLLRRFSGISTLGNAVVRPEDRRVVVSDQYVPVGPRGVCRLQPFLDGKPLVNGLDRVPPPTDLLAIEVYTRANMVPLEYQPASSDYCGVVLVWSARRSEP